MEVRELFYATPARLKFMKSERSEALAIGEELKRQAMAHEAVSFSLDLDGRRTLRLPAEAPGSEGRLARLSAIMGREFADNALSINHEREGVRAAGRWGVAGRVGPDRAQRAGPDAGDVPARELEFGLRVRHVPCWRTIRGRRRIPQ